MLNILERRLDLISEGMDDEGNTPLHVVAAHPSGVLFSSAKGRVLSFLVGHGAKVNALNGSNRPPLEMAQTNPMRQELCKAGAATRDELLLRGDRCLSEEPGWPTHFSAGHAVRMSGIYEHYAFISDWKYLHLDEKNREEYRRGLRLLPFHDPVADECVQPKAFFDEGKTFTRCPSCGSDVIWKMKEPRAQPPNGHW